MKATEHNFPLVPFIMQYKGILPFESVNLIIMCDYSNESYQEVLFSSAVYYAVQGGSNFSVCGWNATMCVTCSNESYLAVLSCGSVYYAAQGGS